MDEELIFRHNKVVSKTDFVIHLGDFTLLPSELFVINTYVKRLNGINIFLKGSHDKWLKHSNYIFEKKINNQYIVCCHYAMRVWPRSHYGSWQLYGHSHGTLPPEGKQHDVGVDNNNYTPISLDEIVEIMKLKPDNLLDERIIIKNEKSLY